jgi:hypothetical protein
MVRKEVPTMQKIRLILLALLLAIPAGLATAQEAPYGEAVGEGDQPIAGEEVEGEAVGEGDEPIGGEEVDGEAAGEGDEPIGGETVY